MDGTEILKAETCRTGHGLWYNCHIYLVGLKEKEN